MKKVLSFVMAVLSVMTMFVFAFSASATGDIEIPAADIIFDEDGNRVLYGDVMTDGEINGKDAVLLSQYLAGWSSANLDAASLKAADVYHDKVVDGKDAVLLAQYLAGWDSAIEIFNKLNK